LARSVSGDLLDSVYMEITRGLMLEDHGGTLCRVKSVNPVEERLENVRECGGVCEFEVTSRWRVTGWVHHWGHTHERLNEYVARYTVRAQPEGWRIVASQTLEHLRFDPTGATLPGGRTAPVLTPVPEGGGPWKPER
jgi:hypothetical protein